MILPDDPDFNEGGDCELREHMPPPEEEEDGVVYRYFNNPVRFVQLHIPLFVQEKWHREKHGSVPDYSGLNLRWIIAEQYFDSWAGIYRRRAQAIETARLERKWNDSKD